MSRRRVIGRALHLLAFHRTRTFDKVSTIYNSSDILPLLERKCRQKDDRLQCVECIWCFVCHWQI